jgi:hypothetical protein
VRYDDALPPSPYPSPNPSPEANSSLTLPPTLQTYEPLTLSRCLKTTLYLGLNYEGLSQSLADMRDKVDLLLTTNYLLLTTYH